MAELHNTMMGKKLIEHTLPNIGEQLERIADILENKSRSSDQVMSALKKFIDNVPNDAELGKKIRELYGRDN
jgi:hypothetical protein